MKTATDAAMELVNPQDPRPIETTEQAARFTGWLRGSGFLVGNIQPYELSIIKNKVDAMMTDAVSDDRRSKLSK